MNDPLRIRPAFPGEGPALSRLARCSKAYWGYGEGFLRAARAELTVSGTYLAGGRAFVAEREGPALGFYGLSIEGQPPEVDFFFVARESIGTGVGRRMWEHLLQTARGLGWPHLDIVADPNAEAFYARMGAVRIGDHRSRLIEGRTLPLLQMTLG
ncbi:MAG: GNAT family N-acetyltransferase [bacterium]